jgi:dolichol-phosphate mannosyltransferase
MQRSEAEGRLRRRLAGIPPSLNQWVRFGIVGGLGTLTNLGLFFVLVDLFGLPALLGLLVCFGVAVSQNYALNELWTFATHGDGRVVWLRYWKFVLSSLLGLAVNAAVLAGLITAFTFPLLVIPQAIGILAGMAVNFMASRRLVFRRS